MWPFVTAYALRAAGRVGNAAVAAQAFASLQRGAALNLSNMENLEWLTGKPQFDDGPVINSRRQLWSVAAYLSLVVESVFGVQPQADGLQLAPFLTTTARRALGEVPQFFTVESRYDAGHLSRAGIRVCTIAPGHRFSGRSICTIRLRRERAPGNEATPDTAAAPLAPAPELFAGTSLTAAPPSSASGTHPRASHPRA